MITRFIALVSILFLPLFAAAQCQGSFTYTMNGNTVTFDGMVSPAPSPNAQYYWWFSDNNQSSTLQDPVHTFTNAGTYTVCFSVYDAQSNCMDSVCQTVVVGGGCTAGFTAIDSLGYVFFFSNTTASPGGMYYWDFGDGNYSYSANPSHVYSSPGNYMVCLTVYDSLQNFCDSTCNLVQFSTVGVAEEIFLQSLGASPNPADGSLAITFNAINSGVGMITFFDATGKLASEKSVSHSAGMNTTEINTANLPQGNYLVKIVVNGNEGWTRIAIIH